MEVSMDKPTECAKAFEKLTEKLTDKISIEI